MSPPEDVPSGAVLPEGGRIDLVVVGDCNPDVLVLGDDVTPVFGQQEKLVPSMSLVVGGSASITAVAAARLGLSVALVAAVGADPAGQFMLDQLGREGVATGAVAVRGDSPTGMTVALSNGGDRAILTALGAVGSLTAADIPATLLGRARHVHVSSYFLLEESLGPGLATVMATAQAAGATVSLDTNWDPSGRWGDDRLAAVLARADLLLPNEAEAVRLSRRAGPDRGRARAHRGRLPPGGQDGGPRRAVCRQHPPVPGQRAPPGAGRRHRGRRLLQRRADRGPAAGAGPAGGCRARLRRRRTVHPRAGRHGSSPALAEALALAGAATVTTPSPSAQA